MQNSVIATLLCLTILHLEVTKGQGSLPDRAACKSGWSLFNSSCYLYVATPLNWSSSKAACLAMSANLASIHDMETNNFIQKLAAPGSENYVFIGGFQASGSAPWEWSDQSTWGFTNWGTTEPNGSTEYCIVIYLPQEKWHDYRCSQPFPYVCRAGSEWGAWSKCSRSCGGGSRSRSRNKEEAVEDVERSSRQTSQESGLQGPTCQVEARGQGGGTECREEQTEDCNIQRCSTEGWSTWSSCSRSCGGGSRSRTNKPTTMSISCNNQPCGETGGLPNSVFPGIESEIVCSENTCDPQISKLYKNTSLIVEENTQKIEMIDKVNQHMKFSWVAGPNSFLSVSYSEIQAYRMGEIPPSREQRKQTPERNRARREFLASLEPKRRNRVNFPSPLEVFTTDANNQGECSACSAFAVTAALETCIQKVIPNPAFRFAPPRGLSSQNMMDCAFGSPGVFGCDGGQSFQYLAWLEDGTLDTNRQYPYLDSSIRYEGLNNDYRTCYQTSSRPAAVMEKSHSSWDDHTERGLENILLDGHAIVTTMDVHEDIMFYKSGVYQSSKCQDWSLGSGRDFQWEEGSGFRPLRHAVVIVGFGVENDKKYWKVKNSWGENWGSSGFFKMIRNGSAHCGLGAYFSLALCKECRSGGDCKTKSPGLVQPARRPPPNLPEEGSSAGLTSHLATPLGGVGLATCPSCAALSACPRLAPCRSRRGDKCCRMQGGYSGIRLYCPSRC